jgi:hypothetical protein
VTGEDQADTLRLLATRAAELKSQLAAFHRHNPEGSGDELQVRQRAMRLAAECEKALRFLAARAKKGNESCTAGSSRLSSPASSRPGRKATGSWRSCLSGLTIMRRGWLRRLRVVRGFRCAAGNGESVSGRGRREVHPASRSRSPW